MQLISQGTRRACTLPRMSRPGTEVPDLLNASGWGAGGLLHVTKWEPSRSPARAGKRQQRCSSDAAAQTRVAPSRPSPVLSKLRQGPSRQTLANWTAALAFPSAPPQGVTVFRIRLSPLQEGDSIVVYLAVADRTNVTLMQRYRTGLGSLSSLRLRRLRRRFLRRRTTHVFRRRLSSYRLAYRVTD